VDKNGVSAAFTGKNTNEWAGHRTDKFVSVQGNILTGPEVIDTMLEVFQQTTGTLAERLMSALEAGEAAGGDKRGKQSAAIVILRKRGGYQGVDDRLVELKVVDNEEPVKELRRQYELWQYTFLASAYLRLGDEEKDKEEFFLKKTMLLLEKAMKSHLDKPEVYNSLAWEFAIRKKFPEQTLAAAKKAHELAPDDANIMDTYAEAYYASGDCKNAVKWEKEALKIEPDNEFFKKQLKKFQQAQKSHR
jgi:tetratricopeptide (TPR) repeat protein